MDTIAFTERNKTTVRTTDSTINKVAVFPVSTAARFPKVLAGNLEEQVRQAHQSVSMLLRSCAKLGLNREDQAR